MLTKIRQMALSTLGCALVSAALAACGGTSDADIEATISARVQATVEAQSEITPTPIPRIVLLDITSVDYYDSFRYSRIHDTPRTIPQKIFIVVSVDLWNLTDTVLYISESDVTLITEDGERLEFSREGSVAFRRLRKTGPFDNVRLGRQSKLSVTYVFDIIPTGFRRHLQLQFEDDPPKELPLS